MNARRPLPALFPLLALLLIPAARPAGSQGSRAAWTVLLYVAADCDLEGPLLRRLGELTAAGSTPKVNVVALVDRASGEEGGAPVPGVPSGSGTKLLSVEKGRLRVLEDWGEANTGSAATLRRFLERGRKRFPAERTALVLSGYGTGWQGAGLDATSDYDPLTLRELSQALQPAAQGTPLELIGFDAPMMATVEVGQTVAPAAKVMVASQELVPNAGWCRAAMLERLAKNPGMTGAELGRTAAGLYQSQNGRATGSGLTLSVLSLPRIEALLPAIDGLAERCERSLRAEGRPAWLRLAMARVGAEEFGSVGLRGEGAGAVDLIHLARRVRRECPDPETAAAAAEVEKSALAAVLFRTRGAARPQANGLSLFFPRDDAALNEGEPVLYKYTAFARGSRWLQLIRTYTQIASTDSTRPVLSPPATEGRGGRLTVTAEASGDDVARCAFLLAEKAGGGRRFLGRVEAPRDGSGRLRAAWNGTWMALSDGRWERVCLFTRSEALGGGSEFAEVPAQVLRKGEKEWLDGVLFFHLRRGPKPRGELVYAFAETDFGAKEIGIRPGDRVRPVYLKVDAGGNEEWVPSGGAEAALAVSGPERLSLVETKLPPSRCELGFEAADLAGNHRERFVPVQVE